MQNARALTLCLAALAGCTKSAQQPDAARAALRLSTVDEAAIDRSKDPCDDFYEFACGGWIAKATIPSDQGAWGRTFFEIDKRNEERVRTLLEAAAAGQTKDDEGKKLGALYATCLDEEGAERASPAALRQQLARIDALPDLAALGREVARLHGEGAQAFFELGSMQDAKDATQVIAGADQGGLGLPDRDYYLNQDAKTVEVQKLYLAHAARMLELAGAETAAANAQAQKIFALESALAKASMSLVDRRDPQKVYHRLERAGLKKLAPHFDWDGYFDQSAHPDLQAINVVAPEFFAGLEAVLVSTPLDELRAYLRWNAVRADAPALGKAFVQERFRFTAAAFSGAKEDRKRWKKCVGFANDAMGQAVGKLFVEGAFSPEAKESSLAMIRDIEGAFGRSLDSLSWMDGETKAQARLKMDKVGNQIGYPNQWRDYSALQIDTTSYLLNAQRAAQFARNRDLDKVGKPLDREDWDWPPSIVNAQYDSQLNRMQFPAGILQPPFFDKSYPPELNYGGIGFVMGHELTHGFDDQGRQYDALGNLRDWWTPASGKAYEERGQCVEKQYSGYTVLEGLHVNGKLTEGENIADIGGLKAALAALRKERGGAPGDTVGGFTSDQRFFLAAAQVWCAKETEQSTRLRLTVDPHSPERFRANGPMQDLPDFAAAFQCKPGSKMAPEKRCEVW